MNIKRTASAVICVLLCTVLLLLTGCDGKKAAQLDYTKPEKFDKLQTTSVAENDRYSLIWNAETSRVVLYDKAKDTEWSYVPTESLNSTYDAEGYEITNHPRIESPITVKYFASATLVDNETNAYAQSINKGDFTLRPITNGVEMVCYFEKFAFTIPVSFVLTDDGLDVSVDVDRIEEGDDYCVSSITIAPFFCSVSNANAGKEGHYLFMPSGSGAIIYPDTSEKLGLTASEPLYGGDANIEKIEQKTVTESIKMPVYGAVNGDRAVCAIIKDGAESAFINTMVGQELTRYSYITSEFKIRGYQEAIQTLFTNSVVETNLYADAFMAGDINVGFYPLYDDNASYVGMAKKYREYLTEECSLPVKASEENLLSLKLYGGIQTQKFVFGIPSADMLTATTVKQAESIIKDVKERTGENINANLIGFGTSGNDIGTVAGGYKLGSYFGKEKELKSLATYCAENGVNLFMNFDMIRFRNSGGGVSTTFGKADAANESFTTKYYYDVNFRTNSTTLDPYYLVTRTKLYDVADEIFDTAKDYKLGGVSLDTLTSMVYSDYSDKAYYSGSNFAEQTAAIINKMTEGGYKVAGSDANAFAAALCSHVYDIPVRSSKYRLYSEDVPFYQIVLKGSVSMSTTSLNLATDKQITILNAVEAGSGLTYSLVGEYDTNLISSAQNVFYGSVYWDADIERGVRDDLVATVAEYKEYFNSVKGESIVNHEILAEGVRRTTFSNGVSAIVNYTDKEFVSDAVTVAARGYVVVKGA